MVICKYKRKQLGHMIKRLTLIINLKKLAEVEKGLYWSLSGSKENPTYYIGTYKQRALHIITALINA